MAPMLARRSLIGLTVVAVLPLPATAGPAITVWKDPSSGWVRHMQAAGFLVAAHDTSAMESVKRKLGVPDALWSCHTATVDGYVLEGHVPATDVQRLLASAGGIDTTVSGR